MKTKSIHSPNTINKGFTLIELVVALLVFAVGIVGILKMHQASVQANSYNMQLTEAVAVAQNQFEILHGLAFTNTSMSVGVHGTNIIPSPRNFPYNLSWSITNPGTAFPTRTIALSVTWQERNIPHEVDMNVIWDELY
jgi:prepilin-type N-terminal cleavage/methylation domain-containing protein